MFPSAHQSYNPSDIEEQGLESGSYFIKYRNGIMVCWASQTGTGDLQARIYGGYRSPKFEWVYPRPFLLLQDFGVTLKSENSVGAAITGATATSLFWHVTTSERYNTARPHFVQVRAMGRHK